MTQQLTVDQAIQIAIGHHEAGRFREAGDIYQQILATQPDHFDALRLLGVIAMEAGQHDLALTLIQKAIDIRPTAAEAFINLGRVLRELGRHDEAIRAYRESIRLDPEYADAYNNLANVLSKTGRADEAIDCYRKALLVRPDFPEAHNNIGVAMANEGRYQEAIASYHMAIGLRPEYPEAFNNLGIALAETGQPEDAVAAYQESLRLKPDYLEAYSNVGIVLAELGHLDQAIAAYREAIKLNPDYFEAHNNLGVALKEKGLYDEAIIACRKAVELRPNSADAHDNLGTALMEKRRLANALIAYHTALQLNPNSAKAHWNLAYLLLLKGDFKQGWPEYEWRWKHKDFPSPRKEFKQPLWDGGDLSRKRLLLYPEQGLGDTIQFIRYAPMIERAGLRVLFECGPELYRLLHSVPGLKLVKEGEPLPRFNVHCPLLSLPRIFGTTLETIPGDVPYLLPDAAWIDAWEKKIGPPTGQRRVGLVWAGRPTHKNDRQRSIQLADLAPLALVKDVTFYSLQKGDTAAQASRPPQGMDLVDFSAELNDFADTAALISHLDLVITVDTAVAHLAGAMGKQVWVMLPSRPDWRWMLEREDSPWYPTMRLFRQKYVGDLAGVVERIAEALSATVTSMQTP